MKLIKAEKKLDFSYRFGWSLVVTYRIFGIRIWRTEVELVS